MLFIRPAALVLGFCLALAPSLRAQAHSGSAGVRGVVAGGAGEPIALAVVELRRRGDTTLIRAAQTGVAGRFQIDGIAAGSYHLLIRQIGFAPGQTPDFTVAAAQVRDLGMIRLQPSAIQLAPIEVTVERPDVIFEPDRTGYLVEALTSATGGVITDALRELPDLTVEIDGTIRLRGATPTIYINGRPAPIQGVSLAIFLEQFPADQIERIEVLDIPPARFNAEGAAGIINIVLKQGVELGLSGSFSLAAGTRGQYTAGGRATIQRGPLVANGGLNARWSNSETSDFTLRQNLLATPTTFLRQDARSDRSSSNGGVSLDLRYDLTPKSRLSARFNGNRNGNDRDGQTETIHLDAVELPTLAYDRRARQDGSGHSANTQFGYQYAWQQERHTLDIDLSLQRDDSRSDSREEIAADPVYQGSELLPSWLTRRGDGNASRGMDFSVNYTRPWGGRLGRVELGSGFRYNDSDEEQTTSLFELPGTTTPDLVESRIVSRIERVGSAYLTLQRRVGQFGLVAGVRGEWVESDIALPLAQSIRRDEANLFPNVSINWTPRQRMQLRLGFSQRVNRPGVSVLDPTNRSTDPLNRSVGNPDIESSTTYNLVANFNWSGRLGQLSMGPYWNQTRDGWERITTVDAAGISTSSYDNLTLRTTLGTSLSFGPPRFQGWNLRANLSASQSFLEGSLRSRDLQDGQLRWSVGANVDGPVVQGVTIQGSFGYQPPRDLVQGQASGQWRADFSFRYRLMNNRTAIGLAFQDPFELRKTTQEIRDPSVIQTGSSRVTTRSMTINVSYAFGAGRGGAGRGGEAVEIRR